MLKNDKKDTRRILTTKGELAISRTVLRPKDPLSMDILFRTENVKCITPLDEMLRICDLPFKMTREMMCEVAFWGQNQPSYKMASSIIKKVHGVDMSSETVRAVTEYVGRLIFEKDTAEANRVYDSMAGIHALTQNIFHGNNIVPDALYGRDRCFAPRRRAANIQQFR